MVFASCDVCLHISWISLTVENHSCMPVAIYFAFRIFVLNGWLFGTQDAIDYIIVTGGTCGLVPANRLSASPGITVAVAEAGAHQHPSIAQQLRYGWIFTGNIRRSGSREPGTDPWSTMLERFQVIKVQVPSLLCYLSRSAAISHGRCMPWQIEPQEGSVAAGLLLSEHRR
ncbi:hypothetical protein CONLIGDRAFT_463285 [Coniochaeta ligniaria NRRL 30616]|uniref:Uncharacterized protein n=1 Tax=Coniochaeta ligniaria NRRL 30616 TaxID=1408157 RepID=A0A1J7JEJ5_9PEZI|nr:hypothetical protein CONLIGDRAFT_463285 [Coniochaeta ligniaria NRRL 30616]